MNIDRINWFSSIDGSIVLHCLLCITVEDQERPVLAVGGGNTK